MLHKRPDNAINQSSSEERAAAFLRCYKRKLRSMPARIKDPELQFARGIEYATDKNDNQNNQRAIFWFRHAAQQGHAKSQFNIGLFYWLGLGVSKNPEEAAHWFSLAAAQNLPEAQNNLAYMYSAGLGVDQDLQQAIKWYRLAAENGQPVAQYNLCAPSKASFSTAVP